MYASRSLRCLRSSGSTSRCSPFEPSHSLPGLAVRDYSVVAMKTRPKERPRSSTTRIFAGDKSRARNAGEREGMLPSEAMSSSVRVDNKTVKTEGWNESPATWKEPQPRFAEHLNALFPTLEFPLELARRILTHASHPAALHGHNAGLSFIGRRVLESYLLLMISSSSSLKPSHDMEEIVARTLNSYTLGETVGSKWGLGRAVRWKPTLPASQLDRDSDQRALLRSVGLYKIQGDAVGAIMGGIFLQFGASVAHRVFHTRILPNLLGRGLPEAFRTDAQAACDRMGGEEGKLLQRDTPIGQSAS